jgi:hypothetical protein
MTGISVGAPETATILVVGLPSSGKSTFLAAFWHVVEQGTIESALKVDRLDVGDRAYLNQIANDWADGRPLERTHVSGGATVSMALRDVHCDRAFTMVFPDLAGELFRDAWVTRSWPASLADAAARACGVLLLVNPDVREPARLDQLNRTAVAAGALEPSITLGTPSGAVGEPDDERWDPINSPDAIMLVDVLQAVMSARKPAVGAPAMRLAVVVSAWDLVDEAVRYGLVEDDVAPQVDPLEWIRDRLPLLGQFLRTNSDRIAARAYGLSAQGGDLQADAEQLHMAVVPEERVYVVCRSSAGKLSSHHDITEVVHWVEEAHG